MMDQSSEKSIDIHLVTWNGARFLPVCLAAIVSQTFQNWNLRILDNGSSDESVAIIEQWIAVHGGTLEQKSENLGFAKAHNILLRQSSAPYIFVINQDTEFAPDYLERLFNFLQDNNQIGSTSGLLFSEEVENGKMVKTERIDSAGLICYRTHRIVEQKQGISKIETVMSVFGVPATLALYRRAALVNAQFEYDSRIEYFDESFGSYKEDVDLAYRLQLLGWGSACIVESIGYHVRSLRAGDDTTTAFGTSESIAHRRKKNPMHNAQSYGNHHMMLAADCLFPLWSPVWWLTLGYECGKFIVLLFTEPKTLLALRRLASNRERISAKRKILQSGGANWRRVLQVMT